MAEEKLPPKTQYTTKANKYKNSKLSLKGFPCAAKLKALIVIAFAVISLLGFFGFELGLVGQILTGIFRYGFGLGGIIPLPWCVLDWLAIIV